MPTTFPSFRPCLSTYFWLLAWSHFCPRWILFAQALATIPHLFWNGLFGMIFEHLLKYFILEDSSSKLSELFHVDIVIARMNILRSVALVLGANKLLAKHWWYSSYYYCRWNVFDLLLVPLFYNFGGHFRSTYFPISLGYQPLEALKPSLLAFKPSSTYTLIGLWCRSTLKIFLILFRKLLFLENYVRLGGLWQTLSPLSCCLFVFV